MTHLMIDILQKYFDAEKKPILRYQNSYGFSEFMTAINTVIENNILDLVRKSPFIAIMADESSDISNKQNLIIYARIYNKDSQKFETRFLKNIEIESKTGENMGGGGGGGNYRGNCHFEKINKVIYMKSLIYRLIK